MLQHRQREPMHTQSSARKYIQDALDHCGNTHSVDDVLQMVEDGKAQLHVGNRCAVVTQEMDFPAGRQLHYWLAGGDLEELQEIEKRVSENARKNGCTQASIIGRRGWGRSLGFDEMATVMARKLI